MQTLTIKAVSRESALGFAASLSAFQTELIESEDGTYSVEVALRGSDREIIAVLHALEIHVTRRGEGPAAIRLDDNVYMLHPTEQPAT